MLKTTRGAVVTFISLPVLVLFLLLLLFLLFLLSLLLLLVAPVVIDLRLIHHRTVIEPLPEATRL